MLTKVYLKLKQFMKENYKSIIILILLYFTLTYPLPYYIYAGGGTINIDNRIVLKNKTTTKGSLNFAYVKELKGNVASFLLGKLIPSYDIEKEETEKMNKDETAEDILFRNQIYLENANQTAIMLAYQKANKEITIKKKHFYIIYVDNKKENDLRVGDEIISVNGNSVREVTDYTNIVKNSNINDTLTIKVKRNNHLKEVRAKVKEKDGTKITGIVVSTIYEYETNPKIKLKFKSSEGGPSGGLMLTLAIYNKLTDSNLSNGRKIVGTGTIDQNGNVGEIGGVKYKLNGAVKDHADIFLVPSGDNYKEALKEKEKNNYQITIKAIKTLDEAITYLKE